MAIREGLLALLSDGPRHGYGLKHEFEQATGGVWPLNVGQVYSTLDRLERDGMVEVARDQPDGDAPAGQRAWQLTPRGREELGGWWWAVPGDEPPPRDELVLKVLLSVAQGRDHALAVVTAHRRALLALLAQRRGMAAARAGAAGGDGEGLAGQLVVDVLVYRAEADLRWLDRCEDRLGSSNEREIR